MSSVTIEEINAVKNEKVRKLLQEALNRNDCTIVNKNGHYVVYVSVPSIAARHTRNVDNLYGIYISFLGCDISTWIAVNGDSTVLDYLQTGSYEYNMTLEEVIQSALKNAEICDYCKKPVGLEKLTIMGICNKSCPACEKEACSKYVPSWYE